MRKLLFNWRYWLVAVLFFAGMVLMACEVSDGRPFLLTFALTRVLGICLLAGCCNLYAKWSGGGKLPTLNELFKGTDDGSDD